MTTKYNTALSLCNNGGDLLIKRLDLTTNSDRLLNDLHSEDYSDIIIDIYHDTHFSRSDKGTEYVSTIGVHYRHRLETEKQTRQFANLIIYINSLT